MAGCWIYIHADPVIWNTRQHWVKISSFEKFLAFQRRTGQSHSIWRRWLFYIGNCDNAIPADELWVTCLETCILKVSHSHDLCRSMEQGWGGEKEEEQVDSREQILLSSEPAETLTEMKEKECDYYVHLTHSTLVLVTTSSRQHWSLQYT